MDLRSSQSKRLRALLILGIALATTVTAVGGGLAGPTGQEERLVNLAYSDGIPPYAPGRLLVSFAPTLQSGQRASILNQYGLKAMGRLKEIGVDIVAVPKGDELSLSKKLMELPMVRYAEPDYRVHALIVPNDPFFASFQWNMVKIRGPEAWDVTIGSEDSVIAILDTGIDLEHPDLAGKIVPGIDFVNDDHKAQDDEGHGTHCAGIAAAITDNGIGVAGVNWLARLMPVKVLDSDGSGWTSDVVAGILWAATHGADVISMSLGGSEYSFALQDAVNLAHSLGVVLVAAAGNGYEEGSPVVYPAACEHVIAVAATGPTDEHAFYSSAGFWVDVAAPGGDSRRGATIYSTYWEGDEHTYAEAQGTSMACPHVAGLAALVKAVNPALSPDEIEWVIKSTAVDLGEPGPDTMFGWGRIDAAGAVREASHPRPTPTPTPPLGDAYEPDDTCAEAREFLVGGPAQTHNFHIPSDVDWVWFTATAGTWYVLETANLGPNADTVMSLYRPDCGTEIAYDDDSGPGFGSRIEWRADADGVFYVKIRPFSSSRTGPGSNYDLTISKTTTTLETVCLPLVLRNQPLLP